MLYKASNNAGDKKIINQINDIIKAKDSFLLTTHVRSDPDGTSSEIALYNMLTNMGKRALIVNDSEYPDLLTFLLNCVNKTTCVSGTQDNNLHRNFEMPNYIYSVSEYRKSKNNNTNFDAIIILDSPNLNRLGKTLDIFPKNAITINIDHHISNEMFADVNWVSSEASSTGEMVYDYFMETHQEINAAIATALYTSILTDTNRFVNVNTSPKCMRIASELFKLGANPSEIGKHIYQTNTYETLKLQSLAISTLKLEADGKIAVLRLTKDMMRESNVVKEVDTQMFTDIPTSIESVSVGILLKELEDETDIKVSLRSKDSVDVNKVAQRFGGGGHIRASGCEIAGSIDEVHAKIVNEVKKELITK